MADDSIESRNPPRTTRRGKEPGDSAFEDVLSDHMDALYRTALQICRGTEADAEDLLQTTVLRAYRAFHDLRDRRSARAWLFTILIRTHRNRLRSRRHRPEVLVGDLEEGEFEAALQAWKPSPTPYENLVRERLRERLVAGLDTLAPPFREVVWLVDVEGFRQREAAAILEIPEGTVASRLFRARRSLRDFLSGAQKADLREAEA